MKNDVAKKRILAIDILRGITIAGMILVNNPGSWGHIFTKQQKEEQENSDDEDDVKPTAQSDGDDAYKPTDDEITKVKEYYNLSIDCYNKYIELAATANDTAEVQSKIEDLQDKIVTLDADSN